MQAAEITVPLVAAHKFFIPQPCDICDAGRSDLCPHRDSPRPMVLRFLPTDADTMCETCGDRAEWCGYGDGLPDDDPSCSSGRRPLRAGDSFDIRAGDVVIEDGTSVGRGQWVGTSFGKRIIRRMNQCAIPLRPGEVVGHATVARVLPIYQAHTAREPWPRHDHIYVANDGGVAVSRWDGATWTDSDISDHLDAGLVFTPGGVALDLTVGRLASPCHTNRNH